MNTGERLFSELSKALAESNPLGFNKEDAERMYIYKLKHLLTSAALGMMPSKKWNGKYDANGGYLVVKKKMAKSFAITSTTRTASGTFFSRTHISNAVRLVATATPHFTVRKKPDWNHLLVTYNVDEPTMHIVQIQSFKTNGYMPMVSSEEVIVQTVKEKIWNLGLGEKPVSSVRSENIYSENATLIRDLYIIAYRNQGKITTSVDSIIKSFASKRYFDGHIVDDIKDAVIWNNGYSSANILDCYPEYEYSKEKYMEELISIYNYTLMNNSSKGAFNYLCEVANTLGYDKTKMSL